MPLSAQGSLPVAGSWRATRCRRMSKPNFIMVMVAGFMQKVLRLSITRSLATQSTPTNMPMAAVFMVHLAWCRAMWSPATSPWAATPAYVVAASIKSMGVSLPITRSTATTSRLKATLPGRRAVASTPLMEQQPCATILSLTIGPIRPAASTATVRWSPVIRSAITTPSAMAARSGGLATRP